MRARYVIDSVTLWTSKFESILGQKFPKIFSQKSIFCRKTKFPRSKILSKDHFRVKNFVFLKKIDLWQKIFGKFLSKIGSNLLWYFFWWLRVYLGALQCGLCSNNRGIFIAVNEFRKYNNHKILRHIKTREHRKMIQSRLPLKFDFFSPE